MIFDCRVQRQFHAAFPTCEDLRNGSSLFLTKRRWFDAMDTREVYRGAKSDYYTHCHDLPPQIGGCRVEAAGVPFKDEIDGKDGEI